MDSCRVCPWLLFRRRGFCATGSGGILDTGVWKDSKMLLVWRCSVCGTLDKRASWPSCAMREVCVKGGALSRPLSYENRGEWNEDNDFRQLRRQWMDTEPNFLVTALFKYLCMDPAWCPLHCCVLSTLCPAQKKLRKGPKGCC